MKYLKNGSVYALRLEPGDEVLDCIRKLCEKEDVRYASVYGLGGMESAVTGLYSLPEKKYHETHIEGPLEMVSLTGNVTNKDGEVYLHLHAAFAGADGICRGGHLNSAVTAITAEIIITVIDGELGRTPDPVTGINVFDI